jgi:hypothetical protein
MAALPFNKNWKYQMVGKTMSSDLVYAMVTTPINRNVSIKFDPYMKYTWFNFSSNGQGVWPWPSSEWSMCLVSSDQIHETTRNPIYAFGGGKRCTIGIWPTDSHETIGNRIWHEILHAQNIDPDHLGPRSPGYSDFNKFSAYVRSSPQWRNNQAILNYINNPRADFNPYTDNAIQRAYYSMLWSAAGYPMG